LQNKTMVTNTTSSFSTVQRTSRSIFCFKIGIEDIIFEITPLVANTPGKLEIYLAAIISACSCAWLKKTSAF